MDRVKIENLIFTMVFLRMLFALAAAVLLYMEFQSFGLAACLFFSLRSIAPDPWDLLAAQEDSDKKAE